MRRDEVKREDERGIALLTALMAMTLMTALVAALGMTTMVEVQIGRAFVEARQAFYAADAGAEWALAELSSLPDWSLVADGAAKLGFVDGAAVGTRVLSDG